MTRPGDRLRAMAARRCSRRTMERLIDPIVADLQAEYAAAVRNGQMWRRHGLRLAGYAALLKVIVYLGSQRTFRGWTADDRGAFGRTAAFSAAAIGIGTFLLIAPLLNVPSGSHASPATLVVYLVPSGLPLAIPAGLMLGIFCGLGGRMASRRVLGALLLTASICSAVSFATLGWIRPATNQAYRVAVVGLDLQKGANELTLGELGRQVDHPTLPLRHPRKLAVMYHARWAVSCAPLLFALFALAATSRRSVWRAVFGLGICGAYVGYYDMDPSTDPWLPAVVVAWLPNLVVALLSIALLKVASAHGLSRADHDIGIQH